MDKKVPDYEDLKWILEQTEAARLRGDLVVRLQRLAEARYSIDLMMLGALLEAK